MRDGSNMSLAEIGSCLAEFVVNHDVRRAFISQAGSLLRDPDA